jgi:hypothetical protein
MDKYLVLVSKANSTISNVTKTFTDEVALGKYIDLKTKAGFACHQFNYDKSFHLGSQLISTNVSKDA